MVGYTSSFERKSITKHRGLADYQDSFRYNPTVVKYYTSNDELVRVEEIWAGKTFVQTISSSLAPGSGTTGSGTVSGTGSHFAQEWPNYTYSITYSPWEETTVSSTASTTYSGGNHVFIAYPY
jgi:hypothetical protein